MQTSFRWKVRLYRRWLRREIRVIKLTPGYHRTCNMDGKLHTWVHTKKIGLYCSTCRKRAGTENGIAW